MVARDKESAASSLLLPRYKIWKCRQGQFMEDFTCNAKQLIPDLLGAGENERALREGMGTWLYLISNGRE